MRRSLPCVVRSATVLALLVFGVAGRAGAGPLNPLDFPLSAESFPTAAGTCTFNTRNLTLTGPGNTSIQGTLSASGVAVFDFNSITVGSGQVFVAPDNTDYTFPRPLASAPALALLSRGDITINGTINASASGSNPGAGGYPSSIYVPGGPGEGQGGGIDVYGNGSAPGGGGFGGRGGNGAAFIQTPPPGQLFPSRGGLGGSPYGDPAVSLQGESAGGTFGSHYGPTLGGSGGAIEIGAIGGITIGGSIPANGGGGSGGGIFLHGDSVALLSSGALSVEGGSGFGGGGGGGRVLILVGEGGFSVGTDPNGRRSGPYLAVRSSKTSEVVPIGISCESDHS